MERYRGTVERLCFVDVMDHVAWLEAIPLSAWPQQDRLTPDYPYPAMVSNPAWHGFAATFDGLVAGIVREHFPGCRATHRMLSVVVPGQVVADHDDVQSGDWRVRVHVPLVTNPGARMWHGGDVVHMEVGTAYLVNTEVEHGLSNLGREPRVHFFFDVIEPA